MLMHDYRTRIRTKWRIVFVFIDYKHDDSDDFVRVMMPAWRIQDSTYHQMVNTLDDAIATKINYHV